MKIFKSILFKYKNELFLGFYGDGPQGLWINHFKPISFRKEFESLKENEFCIVMIQTEDNSKFYLHDLSRVVFQKDDEPDKLVIIGELENQELFESANTYLKEYSKITVH